MTAAVEVTQFTDPACPFAFSHEPVRWALRRRYGEQLAWRIRLIVLTHDDDEEAERLASGADGLQATFGMPIALGPHERAASSEPASRAVIAARLHAPDHEERLLRRLRVRTMLGGLLDDPDLLAAAAREADLEPEELRRQSATDDVSAALAADIEAARTPPARGRAQDHRLGGAVGRRRYSAPSYELRPAGEPDAEPIVVPGHNPVEAYEIAIANLAPEVERRIASDDVADLLAWAAVPLATAEVRGVLRIGDAEARDRLASAGAVYEAAGADGYWRLPTDA